MWLSSVSESKMNTFNECRLKYKYYYHDYFEEDKSAKKEHLNFGTYIHRVFELGYDLKTIEELEELARNVLKDHDITVAYQKKISKCLNNFFEFNKNLTETLGSELAFVCNIQDDISLRGVIDRVIAGKEGGILIIDYKTGKKEKTKLELYGDSQLQGYVYACSRMYKVPVESITAGHYYPLTGNFVTINYTQRIINERVKKTVDTAWKIRKCKLTDCQPRLNQYCDWCSYKEICPLFNASNTVSKRINERAKKEKKKFEDQQEVIIIE